MPEAPAKERKWYVDWLRGNGIEGPIAEFIVDEADIGGKATHGEAIKSVIEKAIKNGQERILREANVLTAYHFEKSERVKKEKAEAEADEYERQLARQKGMPLSPERADTLRDMFEGAITAQDEALRSSIEKEAEIERMKKEVMRHRIYTQVELENLRDSELTAILVERGMFAAGKKEELIRRILETQKAMPAPPPVPVETKIIESVAEQIRGLRSELSEQIKKIREEVEPAKRRAPVPTLPPLPAGKFPIPPTPKLIAGKFKERSEADWKNWIRANAIREADLNAIKPDEKREGLFFYVDRLDIRQRLYFLWQDGRDHESFSEPMPKIAPPPLIPPTERVERIEQRLEMVREPPIVDTTLHEFVCEGHLGEEAEIIAGSKYGKEYRYLSPEQQVAVFDEAQKNLFGRREGIVLRSPQVESALKQIVTIKGEFLFPHNPLLYSLCREHADRCLYDVLTSIPAKIFKFVVMEKVVSHAHFEKVGLPRSWVGEQINVGRELWTSRGMKVRE